MTSKRKATKPKPKRRPARPTPAPILERPNPLAGEALARTLSPLDEVLYGNRLDKALADVDRACEAIKAQEPRR